MTPILLILCIVYSSFLIFQHAKTDSLSLAPKGVAYAAVPDENIIVPAVAEKDSRVEIVRQFFARYKSALEPYSQDIVGAADRYGLDFRLLPSIAMQESNLCKKAPKDSFNCWGFGIYGKKVTKFDNYPDAIETITKTLATVYKDKKGLETPEEIVKLYTPSSNGSWQKSVTYFMDQLQ